LKREKEAAKLLDSLSSQALLKVLLKRLHQTENLQLDTLVSLFQEASQEITVPLSIFSHNLYPAEALCKYLRENKKLSNQEIGKLLNRDSKSVWGTYSRAQGKKKGAFTQKRDDHFLPLSIFQKNSSFLESVILHLHQVHGWSNKHIATLLKKSPNSIAVLYKRAREKHVA
jgi:DNA-directed RNA polymerase specialized sigma24 family protein